MVVRVSLDSEEHWGGERVPGVHLSDTLVDTVLVLLSLEAVVLDVVDQLKEEHTHASVVELVLERLPAEDQEDC